MRDDRERLADILEAIERIEKYAVRGRAAWQVQNLCVPTLDRTVRGEL